MFLLPSILLGCLLAALPIVVHLLHRQKSVPIEWGAMQFLRASRLIQRRSRRLDHWLLLIIRMATLALLALLLARPWLQSDRFVALARGQAMDIAVVIDHSLSMGRRNGPQTLYEQSLDTLERVGGMLRDSDTISVVLAEHSPNIRTPAPVSKTGLATVLDGLRQLHPGLTDTSIPDAVLAAKDLVNHGRNPRKAIVIISDEQRTNWEVEGQSDTAWRTALGDRMAGPDKDLRVFLVPTPATSTVSNLSIGAIAIEPGLVGVHRPAQIMATLTNAGPNDMPAVPVQLLVDGQPAATLQSNHLAAGQAQTLRFEHTFTDAGNHWLKVQLDAADALEADNAAIAAIEVWQKLPVLIIDGELTDARGAASAAPSSQFLLAAIQPVDQGLEPTTLIQPRVVTLAQSDSARLDDYAVVILNDVPRLSPAMTARLADFVQAGRGAWIILGPRTEAAFHNQTLAATPLGGIRLKSQISNLKSQTSNSPIPTPSSPIENQKSKIENPQVVSIDIREPDNPMIALLTQAQRNAFPGAVISRWWSVALETAQAHVVLATTTGDPLVLEHNVGGNGGRVALWTTSVDGQWNNLPLVNFVPLVNETIYYLAADRLHAAARRVAAGQSLNWTAPTPPPGAPAIDHILIARPDGQIKTLQPQIRGDNYALSYADTFVPGLYQFSFQPPQAAPPAYYSVDLDRRELDPQTLSPADIAWLKDRRYLTDRTTSQKLPEALGAANGGLELWPYALVLLTALILLETFYTRRAVRLQKSPTIEFPENQLAAQPQTKSRLAALVTSGPNVTGGRP